jgi:hypothetical protein
MVTITFTDGTARTGELFDVDLLAETLWLTAFLDSFDFDKCLSVVDDEGHDLLPSWLERLMPHRRDALFKRRHEVSAGEPSQGRKDDGNG